MTTTDQLTDFVNEWRSNNPERLNHFYDDYASDLAWQREAIERIQNRDDKVSAADVLEAFATETEAPFEAIEFSRNDDGDYMLIDMGDSDDVWGRDSSISADDVMSFAKKALHYYNLGLDHLLAGDNHERVNPNDTFQSDWGKWRIFYTAKPTRYDVYKRLDWQHDEPHNWTLLGSNLTAEDAYQVATAGRDFGDIDDREVPVVCYAGTKNQADNDEIF